MRLPEVLTVDSLESALSNAISAGDLHMELPIQLPQPLPFCVEALLLQAIVTLGRSERNPFVIEFQGLDSQSREFQTTLLNALGNPHVLTAWVMATSVRDEGKNTIEKAQARAFSTYLDAMDEFEFDATHASVQERANLMCVQGAQREFIRPLYYSENGVAKVRPYPEVRTIVQDILGQLSPTWRASTIRDVAVPLTQLARELVENSDWWARTNEQGIPYTKGVRSLLFRLITIDSDNAERFAGANRHLHHYLQTMLLGDPDKSIVGRAGHDQRIVPKQFIELSVTDSGPGLVRRWLSSQEHAGRIVKDITSLSLEEEQNAVADCFQKWATSSHQNDRGLGLFSVAKMLRQKNGFMRLRTGRHAYLYGTRSAVRHVEAKVAQQKVEGSAQYTKLLDGTHVFLKDKKVEFFLQPWQTDPYAPVEGTSYSILLPV
jgi:hypothetical protein